MLPGGESMIAAGSSDASTVLKSARANALLKPSTTATAALASAVTSNLGDSIARSAGGCSCQVYGALVCAKAGREKAKASAATGRSGWRFIRSSVQ